MSRSRALVFGGSGAVGTEVVRAFARRGIPTVFTFHRNEKHATSLARETSQRAAPIDLADGAAIRALVASMANEGTPPDVFVHCAAAHLARPLAELTDEDWDLAQAVNSRSAFIAAQALAPIMAHAGGGDIVLLGAMDRTQSLPLSVQFAASQGTLGALTMALAKELGGAGTRVNMLALGLLDRGLSSTLAPLLREDYQRFSALRRAGTPEEIARVVTWLALDSQFLSGKVLPVNGGI